MDEIAVIGLAGRFPGAANVQAFWENLRRGVESITRFSDDELELSGPGRAESTFVNARGVLDDVDRFDANFFGIQPREAALMDPQHRIFLECAWEALEDAGYDPERYAAPIGVYAGLSLNTYLLYHLCQDRSSIETLIRGHQLSAHPSLLGNDKDFLASRVSYKLNLRGPSITLQTACSTSLVAVCQACQGLQTYHSDIALAGGVSISFPQKRGYLYEEGAMVSSDGHCRAFDAAAQGTVFSAGVGIVVLKRLPEAIEDRDHIYAVIKGYGLNNDGSKKLSYMAPSVTGQAESILAAHAMAGVEADSIGYVEAHGTGTPLGDPIEIAALSQAFRATTPAKGFCAIGSVKTNVGHLEAAAGVAGLIKTVLTLKHGQLPPTLHFHRPNPRIDFDNSPFYVNATLSDWKPGRTPRRAGVSSFGVGGTNAHMVLEEAPSPDLSNSSRNLQLIVLSARSISALETASSNLAAHLASHPDTNLADAAYTLQVGRQAFNHRRTLVCQDLSEAVAALESRDFNRVFSETRAQSDAPVVFMFPGQGAQQINMGLELYRKEARFKTEVDHCAEVLQPILGLDLRSLLYPDSGCQSAAEHQLLQTKYTQPALFVVEYALARLWMEWGVQPVAMIGHSIGEYIAGCLAGVVSLEEALELVAERGRLVQEQPAGAMLAVKLAEKEILPLLSQQVSVAALNAPSLVVVSGPVPEIAALQKELEGRGVVCRRLQTSHAFHSAMMDPVIAPFREAVGRKTLRPPAIPFITNVTATWIAPEEATDPNHWAEHVRRKVRFADGLAELLKEPRRILLEVGPGRTLSTLARQHPAKAPEQKILASLPAKGERSSESLSMLTALGKLWTAGVAVNWEGFHAQERRRRIPLPTYPFERQRFWVEPPKAANSSSALSSTTLSSPQTAIPEVPATDQASVAELPAPGRSQQNTQARILCMLKDLFQEVSGVDLADADPVASFLELGFDSLTLTQVAQALKGRFSVKVSFRQLMEDLNSLNSLCGYVEKNMPADRLPVELTATSLAELSAQADAAAGAPQDATLAESLQREMESRTRMLASLAASGSRSPSSQGLEVHPRPSPSETQQPFVERVIKQQLEIMGQQMNLLREPAPLPRDVSSSRDGAKMLETGRNVRIAMETNVATGLKPEDDDASTQRFGPFKPIERGPSGRLTPDQQKGLDALIYRYNQKTAGSKRLAQEHRKHFADPRAAGGFRRIWKEMVYPIVSARSSGSRIWDIDGNEYVDVTLGFGANLLGHSPPFVVRAVEEQLKQGVEIGPQSRLAGEVARMICEFTGMQRVTFCNTGSEAVMAAVRVARTVTGRNKIVFFSGDYHGIFDEVLSRPSATPRRPGAVPIAPGIPAGNLGNVMVLEYGCAGSLETLRDHLPEIAAVLVEPVQARHPELQPKDFLHDLRRLTDESETVLIFDEVITGFRVHPGGAQACFGIKADLATYGKVVGGGMPIGILAGKSSLMDALDGGMWQYGDDSYPEVGVTFFAGTFVRHPLAMAAAHAVLSHLKARGPSLQEELNEKTSRFVQTLNEHFEDRQVPIRLQNFGSLFYYDFHPELKYAALLFYYLRDKGVHIWEGRVGFLSTAHTSADIDFLIRAFKESIAEMQQAGFLPVHEASSVSSAPIRTADLEPGTLPLTEAQREMWLASQMGPAACAAYTESCTIRLRGSFDLAAMRQAIQAVVNRHEGLRLTFSADGESQQFAPCAVVDVPFHDLCKVEATRRDPELRALLAEEAQREFDLVSGPLYAFQIIRVEADHHIVVFTVHHIACDGWSYDTVVRDLSSFYSSQVMQTGNSLAVPMQFSEYARWEEKQKQSSEAVDTERFWLSAFSGALPVLNLPGDRPRPPTRSYTAVYQERTLNKEIVGEIKRAAAQQGCTLFALLFAAFEVLLHRWSGQDDIVIGIPVAGQNRVGSDDLVGHCANLLPIRGRLNGDQSFVDYLKSVRRSLLDAFEHQGYTFGTLIQNLKLPRDPGRVPLVSVTFNLDPPLSRVSFEGLHCRVVVNPRRHIQFDLNLNIVEGEGELQLQCLGNADLFEAPTLQRLLGNYQTLLEGIAGEPQQALDGFPLLNPAERKQLIVSWNDTQQAYSRNETALSLFEAQVAKTPEAMALAFEDKQLTYAALNSEANRLARFLLPQVGSNRMVGILLERSLDMVVALFAILKTGCAYVPLDPSYPKKRLELMLQDSEISVLLTRKNHAERLSGQPVRSLCLDIEASSIGHERDQNLAVRISPEDLAYVLYTSGSTGQPKGVQITHRGLANYLRWSIEAFGLTAGKGTLVQSPLAFDLTVTSLLSPLVAGNCVRLLREGAGAEELSAALSGPADLTLVKLTPSHLRAVNELLGGQPHPQAVRALVIGGEALLASDVEPWRQHAPDTRLINSYGPTETVVGCCFYEVRGAMKPGGVPIGRPIANVQVYILNERMEPVPVGVFGELYVGGAGVARGYLNRPKLTAERFVPDPFSGRVGARLYRTGDIARWRSDGVLEYLGRRDEQVKVRGFRIELGEIEAALAAHPGVKQAAAAVWEQAEGDKKLMAYVVAETEQPITSADLHDFLKEQFPSYMVPQAIVRLDRLPLNSNGKVDRRALPAPDLATAKLESNLVPPRDKLESQLVQMWGDVLGVGPIGIHDDFFELGGHSLLVCRLQAQIKRTFGRSLSLATLFQAPTVEQLAGILRQEANVGPLASLIPVQPKGANPPLFCVHGTLGYTRLAKHLGMNQPLYGLAQGLDGKTFLSEVEEIAAAYIKELQAIQPGSPYFLAGHSFGALVAFEMAQQLHRQGESVALLALMDPTRPSDGTASATEAMFGATRIARHLKRLSQLPVQEKAGYVFHLVSVVVNQLNRKLEEVLCEAILKLGRPLPSRLRTFYISEVMFGGVYRRSADRYWPAVYPGNVVLIRSEVDADSSEFWSNRVAGELNVCEVSGNHQTMLEEPNVQGIAKHLKTCLREAREPSIELIA